MLTKWIADFLNGRTFQVRIGHVFSEVKHITSGVPQGGVLSPILFNIFTSEIPEMLLNVCDCAMYADDVKLYKVIDGPDDELCLQRGINLLVAWSKRWQLPLAPHKTSFMRICNTPSNPLRAYEVDGVSIASVDSLEILDLLIITS